MSDSRQQLLVLKLIFVLLVVAAVVVVTVAIGKPPKSTDCTDSMREQGICRSY